MRIMDAYEKQKLVNGGVEPESFVEALSQTLALREDRKTRHNSN